eukprot:286856-Amphidinium_carterae.1
MLSGRHEASFMVQSSHRFYSEISAVCSRLKFVARAESPVGLKMLLPGVRLSIMKRVHHVEWGLFTWYYTTSNGTHAIHQIALLRTIKELPFLAWATPTYDLFCRVYFWLPMGFMHACARHISTRKAQPLASLLEALAVLYVMRGAANRNRLLAQED